MAVMEGARGAMMFGNIQSRPKPAAGEPTPPGSEGVPSMRWIRPLSSAVALAAIQCAAAAAPPAAPAAGPEEFTVETLPAPAPHWVWVVDIAWNNEIDARVRVMDGDTGRELGQLDAGFTPAAALSPDARSTAVSTTYYSRGGHGDRTDVVEFNDNASLWPTAEVVLPPKRAIVPPGTTSLAWSADGKRLYVPFLTPAASLGVIDAVGHKFLGEIDTAGCVLVIPQGNDRVSSLCDNGRLMTVALDAQGKEASRTMSEPFFDPEADPAFVQGVPTPNGMLFLTFLGQVLAVDFSGPQPAFAAPWSLVTAAEHGRWRPGGSQVATFHAGQHRLYVPMHEGGEGTHKDGGTEIWVYDTDTHQRVARWPLAARKLPRATGVQVTQDAHPLLFASLVDGRIAVLDPQGGKLLRVASNMGQTPWQMITP